MCLSLHPVNDVRSIYVATDIDKRAARFTSLSAAERVARMENESGIWNTQWKVRSVFRAVPGLRED